MATTEKLPSGKHRGVYYDADGNKRHTPAVEHKRTAKAAAVEAEAEASRRASKAAGTLPGHTTWGEWHPIWWRSRDVEPSTLRAEGRLVRVHIEPYWGQREMARIGREDVQEWIRILFRDQGRSGAYVGRMYTVFRSSMSAAVRAGVLGATPCVAIKMPTVVSAGAERVYSESELALILAKLTPEYRVVARLMSEVGLRPGEVAGLHRHRVDLDTGWVTVRDTYCWVATRIKAAPKDSEERMVPLTTLAIEVLRQHYATHPGGSTCGVRHQSGRCVSDLVVRQPNGKPLHTNNFRDRWANAQKRAGIAVPGRPYDLRHTYATRLAEAGVDPWDIAALMGHASLDQSQVYLHRSKSRRMRILGKLGDPETRTLTAVDGGASRSPNVEPLEGMM